MNEKPSDAFRAVLAALDATLTHLEQIEHGEHAQTLLNASREELAKVEARVAAKRAELAQVEIDRQGKQHIINFEAARRLAEVNRELALKRAELIQLKGD